ncbi:adenylate/guanylate cyclase domain-containing protein [Mucilaginibacter sp. SJ]|uniref:adenylate/guanylate cyclase domain-containing protein n=1 Tax=Mucilaginibacter sp. SJ TaxID=3029053 RepID=UPI0023A95F54|nr:adenylate/guanylate cyclase domain-containing protein [Mucilaginibacter sp. SJ]WEA00642.1 adenylate/guanylate cyclase domain-containing protein [Mucilaginibacter sp. SJ]
MPLEEKKPSVPVYHKIKDLLISFIGGCIMGLAYFYFTTQHHAVVTWKSACPAMFTGAMIGISVFCAERLYASSHLTRLSFLKALFISIITYSLIIFFWLTVFNEIPFDSISNHILYSSFQKTFWIDFIFSILSAISFTIFMEVKSLLDTGFFFKYLTGRYHVQVEEERIFMFLDLQSSTSIAERLGSITYSSMLKELFDDLTVPVLATHAEIYQYVGDEVILTWPGRTGIKNNRCLYCFQYIEASIAKKRDYYQKKFGVTPQFKAGLHIGKAVATIVGKVKKEIVYHGDVLNTTARMQSLCNHYQESMIVSKVLIDQLNIVELNAISLGEIELRGKTNSLELIGLRWSRPSI